jgi:putative mRNA 3-end processing factor
VIKLRLGSFIQTQIVAFGEKININGVQFSFHPAGHIPGSAQVLIEYKGEVCVITGDYKTEPDNVSGNYELLKCHTLVTETTFALPIYQWQPQRYTINEMLDWYAYNLKQDKTTILLAYALGKSQRIIQNIPLEIPIYTHTTVEETNKALREAGLPLRKTIHINSRVAKKDIKKGIVIAPSSILNTPLMRVLENPAIGYSSGWMALNRFRKQQSAHIGFTLSDHVDWNELNTVVKECGADDIWLMHGYTKEYGQYLRSMSKNVKDIGSHFSLKTNEQELLEED